MFMLRLVIAAFVFILSFVANATTLVQWSVNGHTYFVSDGVFTWTAASQYAQSVGGVLATITSAEENAFIVSNFLTGSDAYWIGATDRVSEGVWVWGSGEPFNYNNWQSGEPNDAHSILTSLVGEDYAAINWHYLHGITVNKGTWNDLPDFGCANTACSQTELLHALIEISPSIPEPSVIVLVLSGVYVLALTSFRRQSKNIRLGLSS